MPYFQYDPLQINRFAQLHNGETVIFCKTDFLLEEFKNIEDRKQDVILISGNSDYCITEDVVARAPANIKKWFCQNRLSPSPLLESIPLGIENHVDCIRKGHGKGWGHAIEKYKVCRDPPHAIPTKFIYGNFSLGTNPIHRRHIKQIALDSSFMTWKEPNLTYPQFVNEILDHEAILCPQGNGAGDNHRIYEALYLGRIPITFNKPQNDFLHKQFPTVLVEDVSQLQDKEWLVDQIENAKKRFNHHLLDFTYWKNLITEYAV